ncbi:hypothetical protein BS47DRAFT_1382087 [Hydnum rufescens UP504]|uniref:Uncharacterized protein n=1 Tax=Hydnum rufescens UP504 TaxID=1448309 RepID=A0A9P6AY94_9AGAM|nr:hypothetical protein BS47DRAFT_1382087 [Hydnum rufescens UP504]
MATMVDFFSYRLSSTLVTIGGSVSERRQLLRWGMKEIKERWTIQRLKEKSSLGERTRCTHLTRYPYFTKDKHRVHKAKKPKSQTSQRGRRYSENEKAGNQRQEPKTIIPSSTPRPNLSVETNQSDESNTSGSVSFGFSSETLAPVHIRMRNGGSKAASDPNKRRTVTKGAREVDAQIGVLTSNLS